MNFLLFHLCQKSLVQCSLGLVLGYLILVLYLMAIDFLYVILSTVTLGVMPGENCFIMLINPLHNRSIFVHGLNDSSNCKYKM